MPPYKPIRPFLGYLIAVLVSAVSLVVVALVKQQVGYVPLLLLASVALVERYFGVGPAVFTTILCTLGSFSFVGWTPLTDERIHNVTQLAIFAPVAFSVLYLMDVRRKQKRVVREQILELSTLLESMPEAVLIFGRDGRVIDVNRAAEEICASNRSELLGRYYGEIAMLLDVQREEQPIVPSEMVVARALRGEVVRSEPRTIVHPGERTQLNVVVTASAMRGDEGRVIGALLVIRDVTEITQLQRRIADTERHLAIGQMASGIAHDFNNVLNTITQAVAVLQMNPERSFPERRNYLDMIDRAARTGAEIIKRVREYIRGGTGELGPVNVSELMRQALDLTEPMWRKHQKIRVTADLRPVGLVRANAPDLQRVFANLIINAIQAMPDGGTLGLESEERDGSIYARVRDTGLGISPEQQKKIFLPYYTTKPQGTGLGLSTAQRTVLAQGGNISFTSEAGKGTTFTVTLPVLVREERERVPERMAA